MISEPFKLFSKDRGPVNNYRIPSIVTADDGSPRTTARSSPAPTRDFTAAATTPTA